MDDRPVRIWGEVMKRSMVMVIVSALALAAVLVSGAPAFAAAAAKDGATDVGVTKDEIRIVVVADVDNPFKPGLFQGAVDGVRAAVKHINATGGVAGRKLKVDFIDSKVNAATTRNAIITACDEDFAMVGTAAAFLTNVEDETGCKDLRRKGHRSSRPRVVRHRRAAVLAGRLPGQPVTARLRHEGSASTDVSRLERRIDLVQGARRGDAARRVRGVQRQCGRSTRAGPPLRVPEEARHEERPARVRVEHRAAERVHADRPEDEGGQLELRRTRRAATGSSPSGRRRSCKVSTRAR